MAVQKCFAEFLMRAAKGHYDWKYPDKKNPKFY